MAIAGGTTAASTAAIAAQYTSSYRVKFKRKEFLELVELAKAIVIYQTGRMHFFAFDGFAMYSFECENSDFKHRIINLPEMSFLSCIIMENNSLHSVGWKEN